MLDKLKECSELKIKGKRLKYIPGAMLARYDRYEQHRVEEVSGPKKSWIEDTRIFTALKIPKCSTRKCYNAILSFPHQTHYSSTLKNNHRTIIAMFL